jgi:hypothetical protein
MRKFAGAVLLASALAIPVFAQTPSEVHLWLHQVRSNNPTERVQALHSLRDKSEKVSGDALRAGVRRELLDLLKAPGEPKWRADVAECLYWFMRDGAISDTEALRVTDLVRDPDKSCRSYAWAAIGELQARLGLPSAVINRLLGFWDDPDPITRAAVMEASSILCLQSWAKNPADPFALAVYTRGMARVDDGDPKIRERALYGVLSQYSRDPAAGETLIKAHLRDAAPAVRYLVLDFILGIPELRGRLQPLVEHRFMEVVPVTPNIVPPPVSIGGIFSLPPEPERFYLARTLAAMGPLSPAVWTYVEGQALDDVDPHIVLFTFFGQGTAARRLAGLVLARPSKEDALDQNQQMLVHTGVPPQNLSAVVSKLKAALKGPFQFEPSRGLAILALSGRGDAGSIAIARTYLRGRDVDLRAEAAFVLSKIDQTGPGGAEAIRVLATDPWTDLNTGCDYLVAAVANFTPKHRFTGLHVVDHESELMLGWLQGSPTTTAPAFVDRLTAGNISFNDENGVDAPDGANQDITCMRLNWLAAQGSRMRRTEPGVRKLLDDMDPVIRETAARTLKAITKPDNR